MCCVQEKALVVGPFGIEIPHKVSRLRVRIENPKGPTTRAFTSVKHSLLFQIRRSNSLCYSSFVAIQSSFIESISWPNLFHQKCCHCSIVECMCNFYNPTAQVALSKAKSTTQGHLSTFIERASYGNDIDFFLLEAVSTRQAKCLPVMLITTCLFMLHLSFTMSLHIVVVCVVFMAISLQFGKGLLVLICCEL